MAPPNKRIDVHHHVLPEFYKDAQRAVGITGTAYRGFPDWTPEKSLALMEYIAGHLFRRFGPDPRSGTAV
jgi:hypothetical protein